MAQRSTTRWPLWDELAALEPADEFAQRAVMRARLAAGDRPGALNTFERLREALKSLGLQPGAETLALHASEPPHEDLRDNAQWTEERRSQLRGR